MTKKKYEFSCEHDLIRIDEYQKAITDFECYTEEELLSLLDFFVTRALVPSCSLGGSLADYGWKGSKLGELERRLKTVLEIKNEHFIASRTNTFPNTLKRLGFAKNNPICTVCPRAVYTMEFSVVEGTLRAAKNRTRMEALLRHIRNSIAHGNTYLFPDDNILLLDKNRDKAVTCFLLIPADGLIKIKEVIEKQPVPSVKPEFPQ